MIVSKILGGFGNQLFQFALGYELSQKNKDSLLLDVSSFKSYQLRRFELLRFQLPCEMAAVKIKPLTSSKSLVYAWPPRLSVVQKVVEKGLSFQPDFLQLKGSIFLEGHFQCEKYFSEHKQALQSFFISEKALAPGSLVQPWLSEIHHSESCAIHIRRGDYVNNPETKKVHFVCDLNYFEKAIREMKSKHPLVKFFCFTDDVSWVEKNLRSTPDLKVVNVQNGDFYSDFFLMNQCKHSIICNSTFSWWSTWLRSNEGSVIAPNRWFNLPEYNNIEIVPARWRQIEP